MRLRCACGREETQVEHAVDDAMVAAQRQPRILSRIEGRRPLGKAGEESRLRDGQLARVRAKVRSARALDANDLVPVRSEIQIEREDLAFRQTMFQPKRDDCLAELRS